MTNDDLIRKTSIILVFIILISSMIINETPVDGHGGSSSTGDNHYQVSFTKKDVSMEIRGVEIALGEAREFNVSVTKENSSMTLIVEIERNAGTLWGLYFELQSVYYKAKNGSADPRLFCSTGLGKCCRKIFDHVSYYAVAHIEKPVNNSYVIGLYNTHFHDEETTKFDLVILKGIIGKEVIIATPPHDTFLESIIVLGVLTSVGFFSTGLVIYVLLKPKLRRKKKLKSLDNNKGV